MTFRTIEQPSHCEFTTKGSRFIGHAISCNNPSSFETELERLKQDHPRATHIVFALRIFSKNQIVTRFSDDGEPSGSAGRPIISHLEGRNLVNIAIFVIRYYGGTKLGVGGLVRAYSQATRLCLEEAQLAPLENMLACELILTYAEKPQLAYILSQFSTNELSFCYETKIICTLKLKRSDQKAFEQKLDATKIQWKIIDSCD